MKKIKKILIDIAKKNVFFRKILRKTQLIINKLKYLSYKLKYKTDNKTILFQSFGGKNYTCSPKAIYEKMLEMDEFNDFNFVWVFDNPDIHKVKDDRRLTIIKTKSKDYYKYFSIAKYWVVNSIIDTGIIKKKDQIYIQCWHGTPLKKLRYDIELNGSVLNTIQDIRKRNDEDAKRFDYFISPSKFCTEKFISAFNLKALGKENIIVEKGYPRNDRLYNYTDTDVKRIKKELGLPSNKKIILYAPTFRDNQHSSGIGYTYELSIDFERLKKQFGKDYTILFRTHYFIANSINLTKYKSFVFDVSSYDDINDLYLVSDMIITDYSSVFFDFANLKRPMLFYMYDQDLYQNKLRDFYISLDELPGAIAKTQKELEYNLKNIDAISKKYSKKYEKFNKKYNYLEDGNASERVIKEIFKKDIFNK